MPDDLPRLWGAANQVEPGVRQVVRQVDKLSPPFDRMRFLPCIQGMLSWYDFCFNQLPKDAKQAAQFIINKVRSNYAGGRFQHQTL
jgi:hypothetical protein